MRRSGFTLIELIVVLWIVMLASLVAVPSFLRFHRANQLRTAGLRTLALAAEARGLAVERGSPVSLRFDPAMHGLRLVVSEPPAQPVLAGDAPNQREVEGAVDRSMTVPSPDAKVLEYPLDVDVRIESASGPKQAEEFRFWPDGRAVPARMTLSGEGLDPLEFVVNPRTGRLVVAP